MTVYQAMLAINPNSKNHIATAILIELTELGYNITQDMLITTGDRTHRIVDTKKNSIMLITYGNQTDDHGVRTTATELELANPRMMDKLIEMLGPPK